ncbi:MAG: PAS domain S-box protein [Sulfurospirillaceae bacterium]|nr:PAS domain S-box protein [Sulfurospirillaceae bacterium]
MQEDSIQHSAFAYTLVTITLIIGLLFSGLLYRLIITIRNTKSHAKRIAESLTRKIKQNESLLKQNEALLQNLIHAMPDLIWLKDTNGIYLTCNSRFESYFGKNKTVIIGKSDYDFVEKSIADTYRENDLKALHSGRVQTNEEWITFANDGHQELLETRKTPLFDENGVLLGVLGIGHDITKRKRTEETLCKLSTALEQSPASVVITDLDANIEYINPRFTEITGYSISETIHQNPRILKSGKVLDKVYSDMWEHLTKGKIWKGELHNKRKNGELYWEEARIAPIKNHEGFITHYVAIKIDITERKESENRVKTLLEEQKAILNSHIVGMVKLKGKKFIWVNEEFATMHGYEPLELIGKETRLLFPDQASYDTFNKFMYPVLQREETVRTELQQRHKDGTLKWYNVGGGKLHPHSHESIWSFVDITEQKKMEEEIHHLAFYDALTQLPNRRLLDERLKHALFQSARSGLYGALLFVDLDNFKPINDNYGHHVGDLLLIEVAKRLSKSTRDSDTIGRFGGDEFIIILNNVHKDEDSTIQLVHKIAENILLTLTEPYSISLPTEISHQKEVTHLCTASIGIALFLNHKDKQEDILKWADAAMYQAKEQGRNKIVFAPSN